jgi:NADH-quinone oxidoreductase subunit J
LIVGFVLAAGLIALISGGWATGEAPVAHGAIKTGAANIKAVAESLFTGFLWPFELTAVLLVIAVIGGVVLARRSHLPADEELQELQEDDA